MEQKNIIIDCGWYSYHLLIRYHRGLTYHDKKIFEEDIIDKIIKEWYVDNTSCHSMCSVDELRTFREYIKNSKEIYCLLNENIQDKIIIILTNKNEWWELLIKEQKLYPTLIKKKNKELIFKELYSKHNFNQWIKANITLNDSITQKMKSLKEYLQKEKKKK